MTGHHSSVGRVEERHLNIHWRHVLIRHISCRVSQTLPDGRNNEIRANKIGITFSE